MQSFSESLNNPVRYKLTLEDKNAVRSVYHARFISGTNIYRVDVSVYHGSIGNVFDVMFVKEDGESRIVKAHTGDQNAFQVFATVAAILQEILAKHDGKVVIKFSADNDEPSRVKLYERFARMIAKKIDGTVEREVGSWDIVYKIKSR